MKKILLVLALCCTFSLRHLDAQGPGGDFFSPDQLDNLLAPVALYPDPLLAQVLTASTFVDEIDEASRMLRGRNDPRMIDGQPWDVSVKAVAHYPSVLSMMSDKLDWTTSVGQAYVNQSTDVMMSIQRLRAMARNQGNLVSNQQQEVTLSGDYISIDPYQAQYIYVPVYDPGLVYYRRGGNYLSFGTGFAIGAWLNYDFNWGGRSIYYTGWEGGHGGWIDRSRRYANNTYYINNNYRSIRVNRAVAGSSVNYSNLNRYNSVHANVTYNNVAAAHAGNRVINRNLNTSDPRINANRGRQPVAAPAAPATAPPVAIAPPVQRNAAPSRQQGQQPGRQRTMPSQTLPQQTTPSQTMPQRTMPSRTLVPGSTVDPRASQRGRDSRQRAQPPQRQAQPVRPQQQARPQREARPPQQQRPQQQARPPQQARPQPQQRPQQQRPQGNPGHPGGAPKGQRP